MMTVLNGTFRKTIKAKDADVKLKAYGTVLIQQFKTVKSKQKFNMEHKKGFGAFQVEEFEEEV